MFHLNKYNKADLVRTASYIRIAVAVVTTRASIGSRH